MSKKLTTTIFQTKRVMLFHGIADCYIFNFGIALQAGKYGGYDFRLLFWRYQLGIAIRKVAS